jgi:hypothetical protein
MSRAALPFTGRRSGSRQPGNILIWEGHFENLCAAGKALKLFETSRNTPTFSATLVKWLQIRRRRFPSPHLSQLGRRGIKVVRIESREIVSRGAVVWLIRFSLGVRVFSF